MPGLAFLYSCNVSMSNALPVGEVMRNTSRVALPISGGQFAGPKLTGALDNINPRSADSNPPVGKVLAIGVEWLDFGPADFLVDTGVYLHTMDGADIYSEMKGRSVPDGLGHLFVKYQTADKRYTWLNELLAVGILSPSVSGYTVDVWQLQSPPH